ncbi:MAG: RNA 2',3'-cyclic phosphodiesterase [Phycisphaerales bacterium]
MGRRHGGPLRLFAAIYPERPLAEALLALLPGLGLPEHRVSPIDQVHLTLAYIGETPAKEVRTIEESVQKGCAGIRPFELEITGLSTIPVPPDRAPARLLAAMTTAPSGLLELQKRLASRLVRGASGSGFVPHLTLCRFPQDAKTIATVERPRAFALEVALGAMAVGEVALVRSVLTREGAVHEIMSRFALTGRD